MAHLAQALSWRLRRNGLDGGAATDVVGAVRGVLAVRSWPAASAATALDLRSPVPVSVELPAALARGELVEAYAFRGGAYLMTREIARVLLTVRCATRVWRTARYQRQAGFSIDDWRPVRRAVRAALADGPLTRAELSERLAADPAVRHLAPAALGGGADAFIKPLHWWGDVRFGPRADGQATMRLWADDEAQLPSDDDIDNAGREAIRLYLGGYAPVTPANLHYWLAEGLSAPRARVDEWLADLGDEVATVQVDGWPGLALAADVPLIESANASESVHLLPAYDPWVMNPGTADERIVPPAARALATRGAPLVIRTGVVAGTWRRVADEQIVDWL